MGTLAGDYTFLLPLSEWEITLVTGVCGTLDTMLTKANLEVCI